MKKHAIRELIACFVILFVLFYHKTLSELLSHCNLDIIKELCLRELSQALTTNVALKRQKFSERSATTILLFKLVKTYYCQYLWNVEILRFLRKLIMFHTT